MNKKKLKKIIEKKDNKNVLLYRLYNDKKIYVYSIIDKYIKETAKNVNKVNKINVKKLLYNLNTDEDVINLIICRNKYYETDGLYYDSASFINEALHLVKSKMKHL